MPHMISIIVVVYALVVAGWWLRHILLSLPRRLGMIVEAAIEADIAAQVSVIVPARNERDRISACIRSLLTQGPVIDEIVVMDDRSDDGTGDVAKQAASGDPRLRVERIEALPDGWAGKAHACHAGGNMATNRWLLFTDADCAFLPGGIAGAVAYADRHGAEFLTLWPRADQRSFWEHMLIPLCGALILYWFPPILTKWARRRQQFANGQFIMIRRDAYLRMGGHECARSAVIEDIPMAQRAAVIGLRMRAALGPDVVSVRMYTSYDEIRDGWTRIYVGALQRPWKLLWSVWSLIGGSLLPSIAAPATAIWMALSGWPSATAMQVAVMLVWLHFIAVYSVSFRTWGLCRCNRRYLLLYPLSCVMVMEILLRSFWWIITNRPILWRGAVTGGASHRTIRPRTERLADERPR